MLSDTSRKAHWRQLRFGGLYLVGMAMTVPSPASLASVHRMI